MDKKFKALTPAERHILIDKGTEPPFTGKLTDHFAQGIYLCKQCHAPLYRSEHKFSSHCGWPSFDDEIPGAIKRKPDADGRRIEILCAHCDGHLGHVFQGEYLTPKNIRHCVNSLSLIFVSQEDYQQQTHLKKAYFAGGCFWGVEHLMAQLPGVLSVLSGFMGGKINQPSYQQVCQQNTGHVEVVEVTYDPEKISFDQLTKFFFEIHDPTQTDGQGPDIGPQYISVIFYNTPEEQKTAEKLIQQLKAQGLKIATQLNPAQTFWPAEDYHQHYYQKNNKEPYCHRHQKRFWDE